jgi:hypothetical protein
MRMSDEKPDVAEYERLLAELDRLEREQAQLDLHDRHGLDEWQRRIADVRARITRFLTPRGE